MKSFEKPFSLVDEFKKFALKGNVIDLAIGVIIGAAVGKIIDSLVKVFCAQAREIVLAMIRTGGF